MRKSTAAAQSVVTTKFSVIEIGRAVAAILVVLHHSGNILGQERYYNTPPFGGHFRNFNVGVDFFFVLSGFIIAWMHFDDIGSAHSMKSFVCKRFNRIYLPYWPILATLVAVYTTFPSAGKSFQHDPLNIILSIFLLPNPDQPVLGVAWTLTHEIFFYTIFALIIVGGQKMLWILPAWAIAIILWNVDHSISDTTKISDFAPFLLSFFFKSFNLEFIAGVAAAAYLKNRKALAPTLLLCFGGVAFLTLMIFFVHIQDNELIGRIAFCLPAVLFVIGAVELERRETFQFPIFVLFLGAASYEIYLVHSVALSLMVQVITISFGRRLDLDVISIVIAFFAVLAGCLYHMIIKWLIIAIGGTADRRAQNGAKPD